MRLQSSESIVKQVEPGRPRNKNGLVAQSVEQLAFNQLVLGSSPSQPTLELFLKDHLWSLLGAPRFVYPFSCERVAPGFNLLHWSWQFVAPSARQLCCTKQPL